MTNTDFSRPWQLTLLTSTTKLSALLVLPLVPADSSSAGSRDDERRSVFAGTAILSLFIGSPVGICSIALL